jgi:hypothetical protein
VQDLDEWAAFQRKEQSTSTLRAAIRAPYVLANQPDSTPTQMSIKADIIARGCERKWARLNVLVLRNARTGGFTNKLSRSAGEKVGGRRGKGQREGKDCPLN